MASGASRYALVDPWLRRNVHYPGSAPEYPDSPLARVWAEAEESRADPAETIARIREQHQAAKASAGHHWRLRRNADS